MAVSAQGFPQWCNVVVSGATRQDTIVKLPDESLLKLDELLGADIRSSSETSIHTCSGRGLGYLSMELDAFCR